MADDMGEYNDRMDVLGQLVNLQGMLTMAWELLTDDKYTFTCCGEELKVVTDGISELDAKVSWAMRTIAPRG